MTEETGEINILQKRLEREVNARKQAEDLLESKALELYETNQSLSQSIQKAQNNTSRLNAIMNSIRDCVIATDGDLQIVDANMATQRKARLCREDIIGMSILDFIIPDQTEDYRRYCQQGQMSPCAPFCIECPEFKIVNSQGEMTEAETSLSIFQHNEEQFMLHIFRDVSVRKQMQEELANAAKWEAVGQLAGGIAHEINTPAQYIGDNLHFLNDSTKQVFQLLEKSFELKTACENTKDSTTILKELNELIKESDLGFLIEEMPLAFEQSLDGISQVSRIVLAMKDFSHPGTKEKKPVDLNHAIETTLTVSRNEWKDIAKVNLDLDPELKMVNCRQGEMNQVFLNLIVNAAHAIEAAEHEGHGEISISTERYNGNVVIRIKDNGNGIPDKHQRNIFNPFFTTKDVGKGTGQGLAIVRDVIVEKHNGSLTFETELGKGTTFIISLPLDVQYSEND